MPNESIKCTFIDPVNHQECDKWYDYEPDQTFCPAHRLPCPAVVESKEVNHIPRTVTVIPGEEVNKLNAAVAKCLEMSHQELVQHIQDIEAQIKVLERDRRAANIAKRNIEDRLSDEERAALRQESSGYVVKEPKAKVHKKSPEEKAKNRKEGFSSWAARLGVKVEDLMVMDDDEMAAKIAKYKASKQ